MPTQLNAFLDSEIDVRYKEDFLSQSFNAKLATVIPAGCYTGFRLVAGAGSDEVSIVADANGNHVAAYETDTGLSIAVRRTGGDFTVTMPVTPDSRVYAVCVYAQYSVGVATTGAIRAYEVSPTDEFTVAAEFDELVVLGYVRTVATGGVIPPADVTHRGRSSAWSNQSPEATVWPPVVRNGGFEHSNADIGTGTQDVGHAQFWDIQNTGGGSADKVLRVVTTLANSGTKSLELNALATATPLDFSVEQHLGVPVTVGQLIRVEAYFELATPLTAGKLDLFLVWRDSTGVLGTPVSGSLNLASTATATTGGAFVLADAYLEVPSGAIELASVSIAGSPEVGVAGVVARFDDVQVWVESLSVLDPYAFDQEPHNQGVFSRVVLEDPANDFSDIGKSPVLDVDASGTPEVSLTRSDKDVAAEPVNFRLPGRLVDLGVDDLDSDANAREPRVSTQYREGSGDYTLMWESTPSGGGAVSSLRIYCSEGGSLFLVQNGSWDGALWNKDVGGVSAHALELDDTGARFRVIDSASASWTWQSSSISFETSFLINNFISLRGSTSMGSTIADTEAEAEVPRLDWLSLSDFTFPSGRTLLYEAAGGLATFKHRLYLANETGATEGYALEWTTNALWGSAGATWTQDTAGAASQKFYLAEGIWGSRNKDAGAGAWADGAWDERNLVSVESRTMTFEDQRLTFDNVTTISNIAETVAPIENTLYARNMVKAYGKININAGVITGVANTGFNIDYTSLSDNGIVGVGVTFRTSLQDAAYTIVGNEFNGYVVAPTDISSSSFGLLLFDDTGSPVDVGNPTTDADIYFIVIGRQPNPP